LALVLKVRLSPEFWEAASEAVPTFNEVLQKHLNTEVCRLFRQEDPWYDGVDREWKFQGVYQMLATSRYKLYLQQPAVPNPQWDYDVVFFLRVKDRDLAEALAGRELNEEIVVLVPGKGLGIPNPAATGVAFVIRTSKYKPLASYLKAPINLAWRKIKQGRQIKRVFWEGDVIFYLTIDPDATEVSSVEDAANLNDALEDVGAGRVMNDPYELEKIREMAAKYGDTPNEASPKTV
jgi:hypothetical protein